MEVGVFLVLIIKVIIDILNIFFYLFNVGLINKLIVLIIDLGGVFVCCLILGLVLDLVII